MNATSLDSAARPHSGASPRRLRIHRLIRRLHLWIGAWGAIAAVLFGTSGFLQNHRALLKIPLGEPTEVSRVQLPVPAEARVSAQALRAWLQQTQHLRYENLRGPRGRGDRWMLSAGNARTTSQAEYVPGDETVTLHTTAQPPLAVLSRLHKGVGAGIPWILLSDSFAIGMVALGVSGLLMWARGRTVRQMLFSIVGAAAVAVTLIAGSAIF